MISNQITLVKSQLSLEAKKPVILAGDLNVAHEEIGLNSTILSFFQIYTANMEILGTLVFQKEKI